MTLSYREATIASMGLFGTSGIRRIADRSLLDIALGTGLALGRAHKDVIIGRDPRTSGNAIKLAVMSGLLAAGARCRDAGIVPTPTLASCVPESGIGVMITASHNPPQYNGIKIFNPDGSSLDRAQQAPLEEAIQAQTPAAPWDQMTGDCVPFELAVENHMSRITKDFPKTSGVRIVVDCACGAASVITPLLLRRLGCDVVALNAYPSGFFPHEIEPVEANLGDLMGICRQLHAVGIAHDGDADRMMAVDEMGRFVPGDKMLVILAKHLRARKVITTVDASMVVEDLGFETKRTKVGDTFVSEELRNGGDFGGEPSGAWVFPRSSLCPDGIYAAAAVASIAASSSLASLADAVPEYPIVRGSVATDRTAITAVAERLSGKARHVEQADGYKLVFDDGWLLCRPSGTEPKIRITAEARTTARAHELYEAAASALQSASVSGGSVK